MFTFICRKCNCFFCVWSCNVTRLNLFSLQLAEYRQRKAYVDFQKKQKKKKKKKSAEDSGGDSQERVEVGPDQTVGGEEVLDVGPDESQGNEGLPTTEFTFTKTLKSGETVRHDQTYKIEVSMFDSYIPQCNLNRAGCDSYNKLSTSDDCSTATLNEWDILSISFENSH